jgi:metallo-beta-lactamase family protein
MRSLEALAGGGGKVTPSAYMLETNKGKKLLIDLGMPQGPESESDKERLKKYNLTGITAAIATHSHSDHVGGFPAFEGSFPIYMHGIAHEASKISLSDSQFWSGDFYLEGGLENVLGRIADVKYDVPVKIKGLEDLKIVFRDARHVLGSSSIEIEEENGERIIFSGDIGNPNSRLFLPASPMKPADIVVMESTYGNRTHSGDDPIKVIEEDVKWVRKKGSTLLELAFAFQRTQDVLYILKILRERKLLKGINVFLDGAMAISMTNLHMKHLKSLSGKVTELNDPFGLKEITIIHDSEERRAAEHIQGAKVIVTGAGMLTGGHGVDYALTCLGEKNSITSFCGYCVEGSPGRAVLDSRRGKEVTIGEGSVTVEGEVHQVPLSSHADKRELVSWLKPINSTIGGKRGIRKLILVHGSDPARQELAEEITDKLGIRNISLPKEGEKIDLFSNN